MLPHASVVPTSSLDPLSFPLEILLTLKASIKTLICKISKYPFANMTSVYPRPILSLIIYLNELQSPHYSTSKQKEIMFPPKLHIILLVS